MTERGIEGPSDDAPTTEAADGGGHRGSVVAFIVGGGVIVALVVALLIAGAGGDEPRTIASREGSSGLAITPTAGPAGTEITVNQKCKAGETTLFSWIPPGQTEPAIFTVSSGPSSRTDVPRLRSATYTLRVTCANTRILGEATFTVT